MNYYIPYIHKRYSEWSWRADNELTMPRIADYILNCVIYLYPTLDGARQSQNAGGSGFIVGVQSRTNLERYYLFAVTNAHVIMGGATIIRLNKRDGTLDYIIKGKNDWMLHPNGDDLAITPIAIDQSTHHVDFFVTDQMFADKERLEELKRADNIDIGIGDDVYIAGRFQTADGKLQNTPTLRFGNIAQMPLEPLVTETGLKQESYLVECHSISGFSGSPVFVYVHGMTPRPNSTALNTTWRTLLLGIDWGHLTIKESIKKHNTNTLKWEVEPDLKVSSNSAMMGVVPVWKLKELLNEEIFMKAREDADKRLEAQKKPLSDEEVVKNDSVALTEEDFKNTLKRVSRKIKPSASVPSKPKT